MPDKGKTTGPASIRVKRAYEPATPCDGFRILVDRLWPRGLTRERLPIDLWIQEVAPSNELRRWFGHDPKKWTQFKQKYFAELETHPDALKTLIACVQNHSTLTLLFGAKEEKYNNAVALKDYLESIGVSNL